MTRASMILGVVEQEWLSELTLTIYYFPLTPSEKIFIKNRLKRSLLTDIYHPYPKLNYQTYKEMCLPENFWDLDNTKPKELDITEFVIRRYSIKFLSQFDMHNKVIYDPACSTGKFLSTLKKHYPSIQTIGLDRSARMVAYAKKNVDKIYHCDVLNSPVKPETADFIFIRFLNDGVTTSIQAKIYFKSIMNSCKKGGYIIIFGHTPILLSLMWLRSLSVEVIQCIGYSQSEDAIFQYYVLKKD